ncbi:hypothetical protein GCM10023116_22270 [Kistimonas scapharcae]|uniref:Uncharacterized protein n=1 Tax=Kistimonas scapharcae TaxID=1036133 RepID=A0ABP8V3S9_9GAMM
MAVGSSSSHVGDVEEASGLNASLHEDRLLAGLEAYFETACPTYEEAMEMDVVSLPPPEELPSYEVATSSV